jgi:hypothetical protein
MVFAVSEVASWGRIFQHNSIVSRCDDDPIFLHVFHVMSVLSVYCFQDKRGMSPRISINVHGLTNFIAGRGFTLAAGPGRTILNHGIDATALKLKLLLN